MLFHDSSDHIILINFKMFDLTFDFVISHLYSEHFKTSFEEMLQYVPCAIDFTPVCSWCIVDWAAWVITD